MLDYTRCSVLTISKAWYKKNDALLFPEKVIFIHQNILQGYQKDVLHLKSQDFEHFNENKISIYQLWTMKQQINIYLIMALLHNTNQL
jgi:hypothetical protein